MGIKDLNKFLQKRCPGAFRQILLSAFTGKRIAVDLSTWVHANFAIIQKKHIDGTDVISTSLDRGAVDQDVLKALGTFTVKLLDHGVTPVFVKDGKAPQEKEKLRSERKALKDGRVAKAWEIRDEIDSMSTLEIGPEVEEKYRKALYLAGDVTFELVANACHILHNAGICVLEAKGEAEKLCSMLALEGWVSAVWSTDTDNLVYQCPLLITGFSSDLFGQGKPKRVVNAILYEEIIRGLECTPSFFRDLCILNGCDYNQKLSGIALIKGYDILRKFGSLEAYGTTRDISCLKYQACRRLFSPVIACSMASIKYSFSGGHIDGRVLDISRQRFEDAERQTWMYEQLIAAYNKLPRPIDSKEPFTIVVIGERTMEDIMRGEEKWDEMLEISIPEGGSSSRIESESQQSYDTIVPTSAYPQATSSYIPFQMSPFIYASSLPPLPGSYH